MGNRGPVPKRINERLGHLTKAQMAEVDQVAVPEIEVGEDGKIEAPEADAEWHPIAKRWFESLPLSGQSRFYEPSDWAYAYMWAEVLSRELRNPNKMSAMMLANWNSAQSELVTTEGSRRRVRLEILRASSDAAAAGAPVALLDAYRDALG